MIRRLLALIALGSTLSCSDGFGPFGDGDVRIRIGNESQSEFSNVAVIFPEDEVDYGDVGAGGVSGYRKVSVAYRYARVDVRIGSTELRIQPRDYVGEEPLSPGRYTYRLYFIDGYLQLELKRD
jgi:hypothetical protein